MTRWLLLARGQLRVCIKGASLPRFLNVSAQNGIILRRMKRTAWDELYATLSVSDFKRLRKHMGRTGCKVHIVKKSGAPFYMERLRLRYALWGSAVLLAALCYFLTAHIWAIEPHIDAAISEAELLQQLSDCGVHIGTKRSEINAQKVRWKILQRMPNIGFFALNIEGNRLTIEATANKEIPELLDEQAAVKVVAKKDGVIESIRTQQGSPQFTAGDAVYAGETIISGLVPPTTETGKYHFTHARGVVQAYTAYDIKTVRALSLQKKQYSGKKKTQFALILGKKRLNLYFGSGISGGSCDKIIEHKKLWLSDSVVFPISLIKQSYEYYDIEQVTYTAKDVSVEMTERLICYLENNMDGEVTLHEEQTEEKEGAAVLHMKAKALEQIGEEALDDSRIPLDEPEQPQEE